MQKKYIIYSLPVTHFSLSRLTLLSEQESVHEALYHQAATPISISSAAGGEPGCNFRTRTAPMILSRRCEHTKCTAF